MPASFIVSHLRICRKNQKNLIIFIMCGMFIIPLQAQNTMEVVYDYDNAGNRILRHVLELRNVQSDSRSDTAECYVDKINMD